MFNIAKLAVAASAAIHLKDADGALLYDEKQQPVRIIVHSPGSHQYSVVEGRQTARSLKRMNDNEGKATAATPEERLAHTAEDLATITIGFENFEYPPAASASGEDLFRALYADASLGFITKQVSKFVNDWGNFKPASSGG